MHTIIISTIQGQHIKNFATHKQATTYLKDVKNVSINHEDDEKLYIETLGGISYEYFKQNC